MPLHKNERTRLNRQQTDIYKHINSCEQFQRVTNLLQLCTDEPNTEQFDLTSIDRAQH